MKYVVTGGAGYLGAHLVSRLMTQGHDVVVIDDMSRGAHMRLPEGVDLIVGDINEAETRSALNQRRGITGMFHLAAKKSISESILNPALYNHVNSQGTEIMLDICAALGIKNIVFTSSAAVYGSFEKGAPINENDTTETINAYGESKLQAEGALRKFAQAPGNCGIALRCFNLAGAESSTFFDFEGENVIPIILRRLNDSGRFYQYGLGLASPDGSCVRDYVHVGDVAEAHLKAMAAIECGLVSGFEIMNVSSGIGTSLNELLGQLQRISGISMTIVRQELRAGESVSMVGDNSKARRILSWEPLGTVEQIVRESWSANLIAVKDR